MRNLAVVHGLQGQHDDEEKFLRELVELNRRVHGDHHRSTLCAIMILAQGLGERGRFEEAYETCCDFLEICRRTDQLGDPQTTFALNLCFAACEAAGRHAEAKEVWEEFLQKAEWNSADDTVPSGRSAEYRIQIQEPGEYQLYLRYGGINGESDSVWVALADDEEEVLDCYLFQGLHGGPDLGDADGDFATRSWETFGSRRQAHQRPLLEQPALFEVPAAGEYVIRILSREGGAALDTIVLQESLRPAPRGDGPQESLRDQTGAFLAREGTITAEAEHFSSAPDAWLVIPGNEAGEKRHKNFRGSGYLLTPD